MSNCAFCGSTCPPQTVSRWGSERKYCSRNCKIKGYNLANKDRKREWALRNKESIAKTNAKYIQNNLAALAEYQALRTRKRMQACPAWANKQDILDVYKEAQYFKLEVDHIIPLNNPLVCGLHVWDNLQLLSRSENARKSNKFIV